MLDTAHMLPEVRLALPFIVGLIRYFLIVGAVYSFFYVWRRRVWLHRKIQQRFPDRQQIRTEIYYSVLSTLIFGAVAVGMFYLRQHGYTRIYNNLSQYGWGYMWLSLVVLVFMHDTYFYWTHRLMHHPRLFRVFHRTHHRFCNPTPFAALSFHWTEALVEAGIVPVAVFILPLHPLTILLFFLFMLFFNAMGHSGFEWMGVGVNRHWLGRWLNTSTHHNLHHRYSKGNYGLYFIVWDRWMGTLRTDSDQVYERVTQRSDATPSGAAPRGLQG